MKVKNTLLFVFPIVVSACGETPEERMERIWKKVRPTWNLYRQDAKKGDYSRFLQDYKEDMKYLKKEHPSLDTDRVNSFIEDLSKDNVLKQQLGNSGFFLFLLVTAVDLWAACSHRQKNGNSYDGDKKSDEFIRNFGEQRKRLTSLKESFKTSSDEEIVLDTFVCDDDSILYDSFSGKNLHKWFCWGTAVCANDGISFLVKDKSGKILGRAFFWESIHDGCNGFYWGLLFDESVAQNQNLKNKCFDKVCALFEKIYNSEKNSFGDYIRFFCNDKDFNWSLLTFYEKIGLRSVFPHFGNMFDYVNRDDMMWELPHFYEENCLFCLDVTKKVQKM